MDYSLGSSFEKEILKDIKNLIETGYDRTRDDTEFNDISLRLFRFQYENCAPYKKFCESKDLTPSNVNEWTDIPAIPAEALKYNDVACFPIEQAKYIFMTSGTTNPQKRGKSYRNDSNMELFDLTYRAAYKRYLTPDKRKLKTLIMAPPLELIPDHEHSPHAYGYKLVIDSCISEPVFVIGKDGFDMKTLINSLKQAEVTGEPIMVLGAPFGFLPFFDYCKENDIKFQLPDGSRSADGGGFKGRTREISKEEFISLTSEILGLPDENIINNLALTETATNFLDNVFYNKLHGIFEPRYKPNQPWSRTVVTDPNTLSEPKPQRLPDGERGVLRHYDLANTCTVMAIQTEDIGYEIGDGFEIIGRGTGIAGCSLAIEEFIESNK